MNGFEAATVSELVISIKNLLESEYQEVFVQGEVSNLSPSTSGHWYFTLSDEHACLSCALFKMDALRNPLIKNLKNGDKIIVLGPVSVYQKRGSFQLLVKRLLPAGEGQLKLQYEKLKAKLAHEGLFDMEKKKALPKFPRRIAIITAEHGAALQDFINVLKRRTFWYDVVIVPALVQGKDAPRSLIAAIEKTMKLKNIDVLVLARGGGSMEDLWAFNDESLVRVIAQCSIPVISAIGHEVDYTLTDYVADFRAETPTAAAEAISQPQTELKGRLQYCQSHLKSELFKTKQQVELMNQKFHPRGMIALISQQLQLAHKKLSQIRLRDRAEELIGLAEASQTLDEYQLRLNHVTTLKVRSWHERLERYQHVLTALNPSLVLKRGYGLIENPEGIILTSASAYNKLPHRSGFKIHFHDGKVNAIKEN
jgi:exodeoxyribonuclease VII large subunit